VEMRIDQRVGEQVEHKADQLEGQVSSHSGEMAFNDGGLTHSAPKPTGKADGKTTLRRMLDVKPLPA
jgi:hypothetical protein